LLHDDRADFAAQGIDLWTNCQWSKPDGRVRWRQGKEASDLNRKLRKSSASLDVAWCHPRGLRDLRSKMLAL
jgi:hypothetical protein